jgi:2Fe-2S ferredoxin
MPKVKLCQKNIILEAPRGENLMSFLQSKEIPVASSCLGEGICSMCKMQITGSVNEPAELEKATLLRNKCAANERLSCQITIESDLEISTQYW